MPPEPQTRDWLILPEDEALFSGKSSQAEGPGSWPRKTNTCTTYIGVYIPLKVVRFWMKNATGASNQRLADSTQE